MIDYYTNKAGLEVGFRRKWGIENYIFIDILPIYSTIIVFVSNLNLVDKNLGETFKETWPYLKWQKGRGLITCSFLILILLFIYYLGSHVGDLLVHDADEENTLNSLLNYTLLSQSPASPSERMFSIDGSQGKIQVVNHNFRRKDVPQYQLKIGVTDGGEVVPISRCIGNYFICW